MKETLASYRDLFPHLRTGMLWLNHAAISPLNSRTKAAVDAYLLNRSEGTIDDFPSIVSLSKRTKERIGRLLNAPPQRIAFTGSTSEGLNILANGIDWKSGDRILLNDIEFPANVVPFLNLQRFGVEIDFVKSVHGEVRTEDIAAAITPRTRLLSISFVQFLSGHRADLDAIGALCRQHHIIFCVDAIQGLGTTPIDVQRSGIDFLATSGHKWLMGMMGSGFIYLTEELQQQIHQAHLGWTSNSDYFSRFFDYRMDLENSARRYENGALNNAGIAALDASLAILEEAGVPNIREHLLDLTDRVIAWADTRSIALAGPRAREKRAGIVTLLLPDAERIFTTLTEQKIILSLRDGKIRLSPHFYCTADDIDRACTAISDAMKGGAQ